MPKTYRRFRRDQWHAKLLESLRQQPAAWCQDTLKAVQEAASQQGIVIYEDSKTSQPVRIQFLPWLLTQAQCRYLQLVAIRLRRVLNRLLQKYVDEPALQAVLPLTEDERSWLSRLAPKGIPEPMAVFERLDTNLIVDDPQWPARLRFLENNSVGVGCIHFTPVANDLVSKLVLPALQAVLPEAQYRMTADPRMLLRRMLEAHAKAIGRETCVVALVERRETSSGGADEMLFVSQWLKEQGVHAILADPRELDLRNGEIVYKDLTIDLVYRDSSLSELISIENHGGQVSAMKQAFQRNQVISGLSGEFDHKSLLELLSSQEFGRYFTPSQRRTFHAFIPWTRLVAPRKTDDPEGREVDLPDYVRTHRETLILKPNRSYGGQNVAIGVDVAQAVWEEQLAKILTQPNAWVVQEFLPLPEVEFFDPHRRQTVQEFVTMGFIATAHGVAFVGRSCGERVVNISRGGSLVPVFILAQEVS